MDGWYFLVKKATPIFLLLSCEHRLPGGAVTVQDATKTYAVSSVISKIGDCVLYQLGQPCGLATQGGSQDLHAAWYMKTWVIGLAHTSSTLQVSL